MTVAHAVDIQDFINARRFSKFQWLIFSMCFVIVLLDGFDTASIGFIAPSLLGEWHLTKPSLAPVLSAALFGLAFGAIVAGPLSDRLGRRKLLIGSVAIFGVACLISAFAGDLSQLTILRFITGIGLGAAMPNAVTMMSEYCPDSRRSTLTNLMFCGFPLGAALGGFLAAWIIAAFIRVCLGSSTVAGLTAAGITAPMIIGTQINPSLIVLATGAGSLMFSHVNDSGFWLFKEYFNLSIRDTLKTWSVMETIVSVVGLLMVGLLYFLTPHG